MRRCLSISLRPRSSPVSIRSHSTICGVAFASFWKNAPGGPINERLRTLIAAYKTLGGSFSGDLSVDPIHLRDLRRRSESSAGPGADPGDTEVASDAAAPPALLADSSSDRSRRIRDAVEAALSDILLLVNDEQVRLAARATGEMAAGRPVPTAELVEAGATARMEAAVEVAAELRVRAWDSAC